MLNALPLYQKGGGKKGGATRSVSFTDEVTLPKRGDVKKGTGGAQSASPEEVAHGKFWVYDTLHLRVASSEKGFLYIRHEICEPVIQVLQVIPALANDS